MKKWYYLLLNSLIKSIVFVAKKAIIPIQIITPGLPVSGQRLIFKISRHYLRFHDLPIRKICIPENEKAIIFLPHMGWYNMKQRPRHLARAFAKAGMTVFFLTQNVDDNISGVKKISENLYICSNVRCLQKIEMILFQKSRKPFY